MRAIVAILIWVPMLALSLFIALAQARPKPDGPVLVILSPWQDGAAMVTAAGGRVIGPDRAPFGLLAASDAEDFVPTLEQQGAWLVLDGAAVARLCGG